MTRIVLDQINYVPVSLIMKKLSQSVDRHSFSEEEWDDEVWPRLMRDKTGDTSFWRLCDTIPEEGFRVPICIQILPSGGWRIGNGHHRLMAAVFLCLDTIPVYVDSSAMDSTWKMGNYMHNEVTDPDHDDGDAMFAARGPDDFSDNYILSTILWKILWDVPANSNVYPDWRN